MGERVVKASSTFFIMGAPDSVCYYIRLGIDKDMLIPISSHDEKKVSLILLPEFFDAGSRLLGHQNASETFGHAANEVEEGVDGYVAHPTQSGDGNPVLGQYRRL